MQSIEKGKDVYEKMHQRDVEARNREEQYYEDDIKRNARYLRNNSNNSSGDEGRSPLPSIRIDDGGSSHNSLVFQSHEGTLRDRMKKI